MNARIYILQNTDSLYFNKISEQEKESFLLSCDEIEGVDFVSNQNLK